MSTVVVLGFVLSKIYCNRSKKRIYLHHRTNKRYDPKQPVHALTELMVTGV
jgi:hypothetical protein